jgi:multidrug efflux pump subunit AcrB
MTYLVSLLERKKAALCILAGICSVSLFVIINSYEKIHENQGGAYVVKIKHYGLDALEMERSVTIPLEDALSSISGVRAVQSSSENSQSRVFLRFKPGGKGKGRYEAVRDAAQRVYETLPSSAQRPEILSSNNSRVPVWSAAVFSNDENELALQMLEKIVKPRLESLEGAGEVFVSGVGLKEVVIALNQEKLVSLGLNAFGVAEALGGNDSIFSGGTILQGDREIVFSVDGRYSNLHSLEKALIPLGENRFIELLEIAAVMEQERMPDILSRLNGKKTAGIAIMGKNDADLRRLSSDIRKELASLSLPLEFTVLSDLGAEESIAYRSVFNAALLGAIMVAIISFMLTGFGFKNFNGFFSALAIPVICLVSAAVLSTGGFSINRLMLAGIAAGIGTAVDAVILVSEKLRKCKNYSAASASLSELTGPLVAGAATTVAAILPLSMMNDGGVGIIANSIAVVCVTALILSLVLLPPLLLWGINSRPTKRIKISFSKLSRYLCRLLAANTKFCTRYPLIIPVISIMLIAAAIFALVVKGVDASAYGSEDSLYAQVEFDGGLLAEEADRLLAAYGEKLGSNAVIKNVETSARTGSGSLLISFDQKQTDAQTVRELAKQIPIPGGFIFFTENSNRDRYWEIKIYGDEDRQCRELAQELAYICSGHPLVRERVLNFKQGSKKMILKPDRELFAASNTGFSNAANTVRMGVYGPVAYKRMGSNGETDVRLRLGGKPGKLTHQTREGTLGILVSGISLESVMDITEETESASIRREDRRRTASITISTKPMDPRRVKEELEGLFKKLDLPPGYSIEFDPEAIDQAKALSATALSLVLAVVFCYMIIAAINESFTVPLLVLSAIPPSLAIPALILALSGSSYNSAIACAFIAVSGMTVNAAVLCVDYLIKKTKNKNSNLSIYLALRKKMPALLATTGTTVAGALPFLFLTEGANMLIRTLSLVGAIGVACSLIFSISLIPSLFIIFRKQF